MTKSKFIVKLGAIITVMFFALNISFAQECGPNCPACSGGSGGKLINKNDLVASVLGIATSDEEIAVATVRYGIFSWMDAGIGYAFQAKKPIWSIRLQPFAENEDKWYPGLILGTGSVRTGGSDQSIYGMLTKTVEFSEKFAIGTYVGAASIFKKMDEPFFLSGLSFVFVEKFTLFSSYDGVSFHEGFSWTATDNLTLSAMVIETRYPALSISFRFGTKNE